VLSWAEPELAEPFGEVVGADGAAGLATGEQPAGGARVADGGVAAAGGGKEDEAGEGFGQHDGFVAEPQPHLAVVVLHVFEGEAADRGGPLGVEQDEERGDPVFGLDGVVVQQPACLFPAGLGVDGSRRACPLDGRQFQAGQLLFVRPADEVPGLTPVGGVLTSQPGVQIALPGRCQGEAVDGEPVEQHAKNQKPVRNPDSRSTNDHAAGYAPRPAQQHTRQTHCPRELAGLGVTTPTAFEDTDLYTEEL
jgi:hypothetical protein